MRESLSVTDKGKTANTIDNCRIVFCCDPLLRDAIRLNLLTDRVDIVRDLGWRRNTSALTDTDVKYLLLYFEQNYELTSEKKITAALSIVANENCYHPIQDVLNSLVWDGTPRIRSCLHHFLGADESDYVEEMLKHFLLGAIRRVFRPGSKYEEMLCLVGGQGAGKSTFFRLLAIRDEWFSDDLKKLDDDRVFQKLQGHWIIEMSEMLATSSAKSIEEIRSFISRQKETYRTPYESQPNQYWKSNYELVKEMMSQYEVYVFEADKMIQGFVGLNDEYIEGIFVSDEMQSCGIGKLLLDYIKDKKVSLRLNVYQKNARAISFYQREGFIIQCEGLDEATGEKEYTMLWKRK